MPSEPSLSLRSQKSGLGRKYTRSSRVYGLYVLQIQYRHINDNHVVFRDMFVTYQLISQPPCKHLFAYLSFFWNRVSLLPSVFFVFTKAAPSNEFLSLVPTSLNDGKDLQHVFSSQEPDTPWHLHSCCMFFSSTCWKKPPEFINQTHKNFRIIETDLKNPDKSVISTMKPRWA